MLICTLIVDVQKWGPDGASFDGGFNRGDEFPRVVDDLAALDRELSSRGYPPFSEWEPFEDETGRYDTDRIEDDNAIPIEDDPTATDGQWLVSYSLYLKTCDTRPFVRGEGERE